MALGSWGSRCLSLADYVAGMKPTGGAITAGGGYVPYSELTMSRLRDPALRSFLVSIRSTEIPAPRTCDLGEFG